MAAIMIEVVVIVTALGVLGWAITLHCKKPILKLPEVAEETNVFSIHSGKQNRLEQNLQMFLDAEDAMASNEVERYLALRIAALDLAKNNLSYKAQEKQRVS
jgi:hypothetical protein